MRPTSWVRRRLVAVKTWQVWTLPPWLAALIVVVVVNLLFTAFVRLLPPREPSSPAGDPVSDDVATGVSDAMRAPTPAVAGEG